MKLMGSAGENASGNYIWIKTMKRTTRTHAQFVVCIKNTGYPASLELHKIYRVLPDEDAAADDDIRVVDESGEDYLYPAAYFAPIKVSGEIEKSLLCTS
jgi:hypothetical protein